MNFRFELQRIAVGHIADEAKLDRVPHLQIVQAAFYGPDTGLADLVEPLFAVPDNIDDALSIAVHCEW